FSRDWSSDVCSSALLGVRTRWGSPRGGAVRALALLAALVLAACGTRLSDAEFARLSADGHGGAATNGGELAGADRAPTTDDATGERKSAAEGTRVEL